MSRPRNAILLTAVIAGISLIDPIYPRDQFLQQIPTVISLILLWRAVGKQSLSSVSIFCALALLLLHIVAARWVYTFVPYAEWLQSLFAWDINESFGWQRNHFDRLVHFAFGALLVIPLAECSVKRQWAPHHPLLAAIALIATLSALYEIAEWLLTWVVSPEMAERYNGQQGDFFDAQKDMALAILGATIIAPFTRSLAPLNEFVQGSQAPSGIGGG